MSRTHTFPRSVSLRLELRFKCGAGLGDWVSGGRWGNGEDSVQGETTGSRHSLPATLAHARVRPCYASWFGGRENE